MLQDLLSCPKDSDPKESHGQNEQRARTGNSRTPSVDLGFHYERNVISCPNTFSWTKIGTRDVILSGPASWRTRVIIPFVRPLKISVKLEQSIDSRNSVEKSSDTDIEA